MASLKTVLYLGVWLSAWIVTTADEKFVPKAENVHWVSLDFKTILIWTTNASDYTYTVWYTSEGLDSRQNPDCIQMSHSECDLTDHLHPLDRTYIVQIKTEPATVDYDDDLEEFPHSYSPPFNPYRETNISAVNFTVAAVDESRVIVTITDPLSGVHESGKQLSLRDILKKDLKYKISYFKSGSTGKKDIISDSSTAEVSKLNAGQSYCFMVAAFIPSRPKSSQLGAWSNQWCTEGGDGDVLQELSLGAWVGAAFILLTVLVIIVTVTVLCCKCCRQKDTSQSSTPV